MKITVIGAGNIGTLMAAEMAHKGHEVTMYSSKPEKWNKSIEVLDEGAHLLITGELKKVTNDLSEAVSGAELIWIVIPSMMFEEMGKKLENLVKPGQMIGVVPVPVERSLPSRAALIRDACYLACSGFIVFQD